MTSTTWKANNQANTASLLVPTATANIKISKNTVSKSRTNCGPSSVHIAAAAIILAVIIAISILHNIPTPVIVTTLAKNTHHFFIDTLHRYTQLGL